MSFHAQVRESFLDLARYYPDRIVVLDALKSPEELAAEAMSVLDKSNGFLQDTKNSGL